MSRNRLAGFPIGALALLPCAGPALPGPGGTQDRESRAAMTADEALRLLPEDNAPFATGLTVRRDLQQQTRATSSGQLRFAAVLDCIDSRVPPEHVFDTGIEDLFSTRTAGNVVDDELRGGLEFGTEVSGARLIVVLGHTQCGAVKGACDDVRLGCLTETAAACRSSTERIRATL